MMFAHFEEAPTSLRRIHPDHRELVAMERMWRAVIDQMIEDLLGSGLDSERARLWFRNRRPDSTPEKVYMGFSEVCDLAGLEAGAVVRTVNEILTAAGKARL